MAHEAQKIWSLYCITNLLNNKVYIGQATNVPKRWSDHRRAGELKKPTQPIHNAIIKYSIDNFKFEVIASCKTQVDANEIETILVKQYDSFISNDKGYNATFGGMNAPKSNEWKAHMSEVMKPAMAIRLANETPEEKRSRYKKVSASLKGRDKVPGSGLKKGHHFSDEVKKNMSHGHIGQIAHNRKFTDEQVILIREQYKQGLSCDKLAIIHDIDRSSMWRIATGRSYKKVK
jgi:group I intron endonuclease